MTAIEEVQGEAGACDVTDAQEVEPCDERSLASDTKRAGEEADECSTIRPKGGQWECHQE